jgi:replication factor A1
MSTSESEELEFVNVEDLTPNSRRVNIVVKVDSKGEVREVTSQRDMKTNRVSDILVGDGTGSIVMSAWNEVIDDLEEGDTIQIQNGYVKLFRGNMRLNVGRYGSYTKQEESEIEEVNTENNVSDAHYEQERRYRPYQRERSDGYRSYGGRRGSGGRDRRRRY